MKTIRGLILTGGGARAAYQVGVLKAISDLMPGLSHPFPVILGTSAGALNAAGLAGGTDIFRHNVDKLQKLWSEIDSRNVYKSNTLGITLSMGKFLQAVIRGESTLSASAMLDSAPLRDFLASQIDFDQIKSTLKAGKIRALGINACGYSCGQSICFFEGAKDIEGWHRGQRLGVRSPISVDHLMASSAIPTIFPPVRINREYFGDGATRQMAHLSPAIHLGANKILVIGVSANRIHRPPRHSAHLPPNMGQVMENILNGIFIDTLEYDIDRMQAMNQLLLEVPEARRKQQFGEITPIDFLEISPTTPIFEISAQYIKRLPAMLRRIMGRNLEEGEGGASLASYLLFDAEFCRELISLGYQDAQKKAREIDIFFSEAPVSFSEASVSS